jgi:hypothetical protein
MTKIQKIIVTIIAMMLLSSVGYGVDWKHFSSNTYSGDLFYDTESIYSGKETTKVTEKIVLSDQGKVNAIRDYQNTNINGIENISSQEIGLEINCTTRGIKVIYSVLYDSKGDVIKRRENLNESFYNIVPNSVGDRLAEIICKQDEGGRSNALPFAGAINKTGPVFHTYSNNMLTGF